MVHEPMMDATSEQQQQAEKPTPTLEYAVESVLPAHKGFFHRLYQIACQVKWSNVFLLSSLHLLWFIGIHYLFTHTINIRTVIFTYLIGAFSGFGITVGAHRLFAHRSFKARLPLRILLAICEAMTMNGSIYSYGRDHRTHHKYSDTECDPKNPSRGIFYSHIGWWCLKKSQAVKDAGSKLDFSDLRDDWVVWYQHKFYTPLFLIFGVALPWAIPVYCWNENPVSAFFFCVIWRIAMILHHMFTVNSLAHFFGYRPYDFRIRPTENRLIVYLSFGEGYHNYHHSFPYDYTTSGRQLWECFNPSTLLIDLCKALGLAYDCKKASAEVIQGTIKRSGIPAHFDPPRGLCFRITSGFLDWLVGFAVAVYPVGIGLLYQYGTGRTVFVW